MISKSGEKLREMINKIIEDHIITPDEYDQIITLAEEDGHIDAQEQALLKELQGLIEDKIVKFQRK